MKYLARLELRKKINLFPADNQIGGISMIHELFSVTLSRKIN